MKNKYNYSVIRFVPDPYRGEFVNIGALVGSDESLEWQLRLISNLKRARALDENGAISRVLDYVINYVGKQIDDYTQSIENDIPTEIEVNEQWLTKLWEDNQSTVQFSYPTMLLADTVSEALEQVFDHLIVDQPKRGRAHFRTRLPAVAAIRNAYTIHDINKLYIKERVLFSGNNHQERFDFAIVKKEALQLSHAFSFQLPDKDELSKNVRAWSWTVRDLRSNGGELRTDSDTLEISKDVDIEVAIIPPTVRGDDRVFREAKDAFEENEVSWVEIDNVSNIANKALQHLSSINEGVPH